MSYESILTHPDPALRAVARPVDREFIDSGELGRLIVAMKFRLALAGGVGIAANQVGGDRRVIVIAVDDLEFTMLNPVILHRRGRAHTTEQCLSVRDAEGKLVAYRVERPRHITVRFNFLERVGERVVMREKCINAKDLLAACICHEVDHLNGITIVERSKRAAA